VHIRFACARGAHTLAAPGGRSTWSLDNMKRAFLLLIGSLAFCGAVWASQGCLSYEPSVVTLEGTVSERTYPGPPNFESIASGDRPVEELVLVLVKPICVAAPAGPNYAGGFDTPVDAATEVTLVSADKALPRSGTKLRVTGMLFHRFTAYHYTDLLLRVKRFHVV